MDEVRRLRGYGLIMFIEKIYCALCDMKIEESPIKVYTSHNETEHLICSDCFSEVIPEELQNCFRCECIVNIQCTHKVHGEHYCENCYSDQFERWK